MNVKKWLLQVVQSLKHLYDANTPERFPKYCIWMSQMHTQEYISWFALQSVLRAEMSRKLVLFPPLYHSKGFGTLCAIRPCSHLVPKDSARARLSLDTNVNTRYFKDPPQKSCTVSVPEYEVGALKCAKCYILGTQCQHHFVPVPRHWCSAPGVNMALLTVADVAAVPVRHHGREPDQVPSAWHCLLELPSIRKNWSQV